MTMPLTIAAAVIAVVAFFIFSDKLQGIVVWLCVLLGLILAIQTVGCESFAERRQKRQEQRQERFQNWREDRKILPINDDDEKERRWHRRRFPIFR